MKGIYSKWFKLTYLWSGIPSGIEPKLLIPPLIFPAMKRKLRLYHFWTPTHWCLTPYYPVRAVCVSALAQSHQHAGHSFNHIIQSPPSNTNWEIQTYTMPVTHFSTKFQKCDRTFRIFSSPSDDQILILMYSEEKRGQRVSLRTPRPPFCTLH